MKQTGLVVYYYCHGSGQVNFIMQRVNIASAATPSFHGRDVRRERDAMCEGERVGTGWARAHELARRM